MTTERRSAWRREPASTRPPDFFAAADVFGAAALDHGTTCVSASPDSSFPRIREFEMGERLPVEGVEPRSLIPPTLGDPAVMRRAVKHVALADPAIERLVKMHGPIEFRPRGMVFRMLVRSILSQQLNGHAASLIIARVNRLFLPGRITPERLLLAPTGELRKAGVSPQKAVYLKDLASRVVDGKLELKGMARMTDEQAIQAMDEVKGVGRWTAQMVLMFALGRPDVLPVDDYGIKLGVKHVYHLHELPKPRRIEKIAEPWHPYSTVACLYLWRHRNPL